MFFGNSFCFADLFMESRSSTSKAKSVGKMKTYFSKTGMRLEMDFPPYLNSITIVRAKDNLAYSIDPVKKTYTVDSTRDVMNGRSKKVKGASPYAEALSGMKMKESIKVLTKAVGPKLLGQPTTYYKIEKSTETDVSGMIPKGMEAFMPKGSANQKQKVILELWMADKIKPNTGMDEELKQIQKSLMGAMDSMKIELSKELVNIQNSGILLKSIEKSAAAGVTTTEVIKLSQEKLPDSVFAPPLGYKKVAASK